jgi:Domain of unknown function (DUF4337)
MKGEVATERNRVDRFDFAEVFLKAGLVITSITLPSGRRFFWGLGVILAAIGFVLTATASFLH